MAPPCPTSTSGRPGTPVIVLVNSDYQDTPYDQWLAGTGLDLHVLVAAEKRAGYAHLPNVRGFNSYRDNDAVAETAVRIGRRASAGFVFAKSEPDILRAARARAQLGWPGQDVPSATAFRNKLVMKRTAAEAGIPVPPAVAVRQDADLTAFVEQHGFPVVVKPIYGSGSLGTSVLGDQHDLQRWLGHPFPDEMEAEAFVPGPMYLVDGLVTDSRVVLAYPSRYINDCLSFQRGEFLGICMLAGDHPLRERLVAFTHRLLQALPTPRATTFHAEVFHTPSDELVLCEVASRTGGARTRQMLELATGVNVDRAWLRASVGQGTSGVDNQGVLPDGRPMFGQILIYPKDGIFERPPATPRPSCVADEKIVGRPGERFYGGYKSGDTIASYVVTAATEDMVEQGIREVADWFETEASWKAVEAG